MRFRRQQPIGPYVVDFFCSAAGLVVEIDGPCMISGRVRLRTSGGSRRRRLSGATHHRWSCRPRAHGVSRTSCGVIETRLPLSAEREREGARRRGEWHSTPRRTISPCARRQARASRWPIRQTSPSRNGFSLARSRPSARNHCGRSHRSSASSSGRAGQPEPDDLKVWTGSSPSAARSSDDWYSCHAASARSRTCLGDV